MPDRKCVWPSVAEQSKGRATCPNIFNERFLQRDNCGSCPKVALDARMNLSQGPSAVERDADSIMMRNLIRDGYHHYR